MRVLGVDHGEKRIGLAVSDETGTVARPLKVIRHTTREMDAKLVGEAAMEQGVGLIIVGQSFDEEGRPNAAGWRAQHFSEALKGQTATTVVLWDESMSSHDARAVRLAAGVRKKGRAAAIDAQAAAVILQSYLDAQAPSLTKTSQATKRG